MLQDRRSETALTGCWEFHARWMILTARANFRSTTVSTDTYRTVPLHVDAMLVCRDCGRESATGWRCACGHPLDFAEPPIPARESPPGSLDRDRGLWAFSEFLPVERRVTLGEGWTPLVDSGGWNATFKLESLFPTGSFKDRGAAVTVSRGLERGVDRVLEDSSGNAGLAIATYAARAGIDADIYVPASAKPTKLRAIERTGADMVPVEGSRADVADACVAAVEAGEGWYASHAWNPAFFAGTATFALELAAQREWQVPDAVVTPLGHGTLLLGAYRGFRALREAGWTDEIPRLVGAQAAGSTPLVDALAEIDGASALTAAGDGVDDTDSGGEAVQPAENDLADGIQIHKPVRREQILDAIVETNGAAVAVGATATKREHDRLAQAGFHVEPTSATATAAFARCRDRGVLDPEDDVIVALTGTGLNGK
jgi:threonine synthase